MMSNQKPTITLAERLKRARQDAGYSQKKLGEELKLSDKAVSSYEVGRATPSIETLKDISRLTHRPVSYFFDEVDPDDLELQMKIKTIEKELLEVKRLLKARPPSPPAGGYGRTRGNR